MIVFGELGSQHVHTHMHTHAYKLIIWVTFTLDDKHCHLAVRQTYDLVKFCLFSGREKTNKMTFWCGRRLLKLTTL